MAGAADRRRRAAEPGGRTPVFAKVYENKPPPLPAGYRGDPAIEVRLHELDLYVTMRCNIRCRFCNVRAGEYDHKSIPLARIVSLLDEAAALGLQEVHFLGGEPTLRPDLEDMIAHARRAGPAHADHLQRDVALPRPLGAPDLHGTARDHDLRRRSGGHAQPAAVAGPDGFATTMATARDAIDLGLRTRISAVAYIDNYDEMIALMERVEAMGADIFSVFLGSPLGRGHTLLDRVVDPYAWRACRTP